MQRYAPYLPALLALAPLFFTRPALTLFPADREKKVTVYSDRGESNAGAGSMAAVATEGDSAIVFNYTLKRNAGGMDPYAGCTVTFTETNNFVDISGYRFLDVDIVMKNGASFIIKLKTFIEGFTDIDDWRTYHFETVQVPLHMGSIHYRIPLEDFKVPEFWWKEIGTIASRLPHGADYTKLFGIDFQHGSGEPTDVSAQIVITKIRFTKDLTRIYMLIAAVIATYILIVFIIRRIKAIRTNPDLRQKRLPYTRLDVGSHASEEADRIAAYIGKCFQDPELTIKQVAKEIGIYAPRISTILQAAYKLSFRQYLNEIRIAEAKRLLHETDRTIAEIGFAVGFNNITHFNRVFKSSLNVSPKEYREKGNKS